MIHLFCFIFGGFVVWLLLRRRVSTLQAQIQEVSEEAVKLSQQARAAMRKPPQLAIDTSKTIRVNAKCSFPCENFDMNNNPEAEELKAKCTVIAKLCDELLPLVDIVKSFDPLSMMLTYHATLLVLTHDDE